jgi:23S rRNA (adenine2503-C2)-methyltransferase
MATDSIRIEAGRAGDSSASKALFGMAPEELHSLVVGLGLPKYRAAQLADALYKQRVEKLEDVTTLPTELRERLAAEGYSVGLPEIAQATRSVDGTERYLMRMADGETVETVWMPDGDGGERGDGSEAAAEEEGEDEWDVQPTLRDEAAKDGAPGSVGGYKRATICISSQVGCAVNCQFCLTAKLGMRRNLTAGEIAGQVAAVLNRQRVRIGSGRGVQTPSRINLVFMGMGEPFLNYDALMQSVHLLRAMGIPESRMTVSTSGILPGIMRFANEPIRPKLALSLNASNDAVRQRIMPVTRKWKIAALLDALRSIPFGKREYVTFEYVLLGGVNDQPRHAREVLVLLAGMKSKVNLIVWNPGPGIGFREPAPADVAVFHRMLIDGGIPTFTRKPRGRDIYAACGQLKRTVDAPGPLVEIASASTSS